LAVGRGNITGNQSKDIHNIIGKVLNFWGRISGLESGVICFLPLLGDPVAHITYY